MCGTKIVMEVHGLLILCPTFAHSFPYYSLLVLVYMMEKVLGPFERASQNRCGLLANPNGRRFEIKKRLARILFGCLSRNTSPIKVNPELLGNVKRRVQSRCPIAVQPECQQYCQSYCNARM